MKENGNRELLEEKQLTNGMLLTVFDQSKKIAGDRWNISLVCETTIPKAMLTDFIDRQENVVEGEKEYILSRIEQAGVHQITKERRFVPVEDVADLKKELVSQIMNTVLPYLDTPVYPRKLTAKIYDELKKEWLIEVEKRKHAAAADAGESSDDDEMRDFSSCFTDEINS